MTSLKDMNQNTTPTGYAAYQQQYASRAPTRSDMKPGGTLHAWLDGQRNGHNAALEEAARAVEGMGDTAPPMSYGVLCAAAIRALMTAPAGAPSSLTQDWTGAADEWARKYYSPAKWEAAVESFGAGVAFGAQAGASEDARRWQAWCNFTSSQNVPARMAMESVIGPIIDANRAPTKAELDAAIDAARVASPCAV